MRDTSYPRLTLLLQAFGSLLLGFEACLRHHSDVVVDTVGCAFAYPAFFASGSRIFAYVHYPFISDDMLQRVRDGKLSYNNLAVISGNKMLTRAKLAYYGCIFWAYRLCGSLVEGAMANSRWTEAHMRRAWGKTPLSVVYPPCDVEKFISTNSSARKRQIVSLAQFRPEKDHELQLRAFSLLNNRDVKLILVGGARCASDRDRIAKLKELAASLKLSDRVVFEVDAPFERIQFILRESLIGLHTMTDEHFGISVVEFMAAGLITVAHDSGGPRSDIIEPGVDGFRATRAEEYAALFGEILDEMTEGEKEKMRSRALHKARTLFSTDQFSSKFFAVLSPLFSPIKDS